MYLLKKKKKQQDVSVSVSAFLYNPKLNILSTDRKKKKTWLCCNLTKTLYMYTIYRIYLNSEVCAQNEPKDNLLTEAESA